MKQQDPEFIQFIIDQETSTLEEQRSKLKIEISYLKGKIEKLENTSVTPFGDEVNKHFPMGRVGFMGGKGAKTMAREFDKNIEKCNQLDVLNLELRTAENQYKGIEKTNRFILAPNKLKSETYTFIIDMLKNYDDVIKTGILKEKTLTALELSYVKEDRKTWVKKYNTKIKKYTELYGKFKKSA